MREGKEQEMWERLSFQLANQAAFQGAKNIKVEQFNKFDMRKTQRVSDPEAVKRSFLK